MAEKEKPDMSIHPRVVKTGNSVGRTVHEKVNTSKKPSRGTLERKLAAMAKHMEVHKSDGATSGHMRKVQDRLNSI